MDVSKNCEQKCSLDVFKLIQPDLLSVDELVSILQQRGVGPSLLSQSKDKLVSLFKRVALPLPQRELRQNYRESLLMKLRKKAERKKICEAANQSNTFTIGISGNSTRVSHESTRVSHESKPSGDRLKPPPDLINHERKKIRLNSNISSAEKSKHNHTSDLDKVVIKKRKTSENCDNLPVEMDGVITNEKSGDASKLDRLKIDSNVNAPVNNKDSDIPSKGCNGTKNIVPKKVSIKRSHLFSKTSSSTSESNTDKSTPEPDTKRKPITLPL